MFKFGFSSDCSMQEEEEEEKRNDKVEWIVASEIKIQSDDVTGKYICNEYHEEKSFSDISLKLVQTDKVVTKLKEENYKAIVEAESQHSDLITAKYEGGLKVWECTNDLANYLLQQNYSFNTKKVLDLGCGSGIIGILCLIKGSTVDFQDYNKEVITHVTIPNVILNFNDHVVNSGKVKFYCGDWKSFLSLILENSNEKYDFIFTCETIYNSDNHNKLYQVFKEKLKFGGLGFVAGKTHYFGVGGSMRQFENLVLNDGYFKVQTVWKSNEGLQKEIIVLSHR
ncbi:histidine protein methyltransferase 1 homolog isoform X2 [Leptopilina heterotoma]|uniref:histidine protein methyltransferase 1 homolog isoform X2 n=1 Tax=Leptopilina heterotoma TaxID=63436 RepID=UPI001CA91A32|nr:histidine protein methyltransferase 1 homolog isoform X2 [Leptopilina heterotoma]